MQWQDIASIEAARSDNVTGAVTTVVITKIDGSKVVGRGASSYRRHTVEHWRDQLVTVQRNNA
jgi:hypothetical protein